MLCITYYQVRWILDFADELVSGVLKKGYLTKGGSCETQLEETILHTKGEHHEILCVQRINAVKGVYHQV